MLLTPSRSNAKTSTRCSATSSTTPASSPAPAWSSRRLSTDPPSSSPSTTTAPASIPHYATPSSNAASAPTKPHPARASDWRSCGSWRSCMEGRSRWNVRRRAGCGRGWGWGGADQTSDLLVISSRRTSTTFEQKDRDNSITVFLSSDCDFRELLFRQVFRQESQEIIRRLFLIVFIVANVVAKFCRVVQKARLLLRKLNVTSREAGSVEPGFDQLRLVRRSLRKVDYESVF